MANASEPNTTGTESTADRDRVAFRRPTVAEALADSGKSLAEVWQYVGYLLSAKIDQLRLSIQTLILYAVLGVIAGIVAVSVLIVAVVFLFTGLAHGLGAALGGRDWLGDLIVAGAVLGAVAISLGGILAKFKMASRQRTMGKYEERRRQQREQFGQDIDERASN